MHPHTTTTINGCHYAYDTNNPSTAAIINNNNYPLYGTNTSNSVYHPCQRWMTSSTTDVVRQPARVDSLPIAHFRSTDSGEDSWNSTIPVSGRSSWPGVCISSGNRNSRTLASAPSRLSANDSRGAYDLRLVRHNGDFNDFSRYHASPTMTSSVLNSTESGIGSSGGTGSCYPSTETRAAGSRLRSLSQFDEWHRMCAAKRQVESPWRICNVYASTSSVSLAGLDKANWLNYNSSNSAQRQHYDVITPTASQYVAYNSSIPECAPATFVQEHQLNQQYQLQQQQPFCNVLTNCRLPTCQSTSQCHNSRTVGIARPLPVENTATDSEIPLQQRYVDNDNQTASHPATERRRRSAKDALVPLVVKAIISSQTCRLSLADICKYISDHSEIYRTTAGVSGAACWQNNVRHTLSHYEFFIKNGRLPTGRGNYWTVHPVCRQRFADGDYRIKKARHAVQMFEKNEIKNKHGDQKNDDCQNNVSSDL